MPEKVAVRECRRAGEEEGGEVEGGEEERGRVARGEENVCAAEWERTNEERYSSNTHGGASRENLQQGTRNEHIPKRTHKHVATNSSSAGMPHT